jgi:hypothetical protein
MGKTGGCLCVCLSAVRLISVSSFACCLLPGRYLLAAGRASENMGGPKKCWPANLLSTPACLCFGFSDQGPKGKFSLPLIVFCVITTTTLLAG